MFYKVMLKVEVIKRVIKLIEGIINMGRGKFKAIPYINCRRTIF